MHKPLAISGPVILLSMALTGPVWGIDIVPLFNGGMNVAPINNQDPAGANLTSLFNYVANYYEDIFEDVGHTLTINFWWEDLDPIATNRLGQHDLFSQSNPPLPFPPTYCSSITSPNPLCRETVANIRIDNDRSWFFDATPANDSEFNMQQTLWRDLPTTGAGSQGDLFNDFSGNVIPPTLEVGFGGPATGGGAVGNVDALSVILHEVGHALGMSFLNNSTIAETGDNDYDFNPNFVFGRTIAAEVADGGNIGHLDTDGNTLMGPNLPGGRIRPSHADLFAMAAGHSYSLLDVPRREFYGGNDWHVNGNWSGNQIPGGADVAFIRHGGFVALSDNATVDSLVVDEQSQLASSMNRLTIVDSLTIQNTPGTGTTLLSVSAGGEVIADQIIVNSNSRMFVAGSVDANDIIIAADAEITGADGIVDVTNAVGGFRNDGRVAAQFGGTLTIDSDNLLDLDGDSGDGVLVAVNGDLVFNASLTDVFNGTATVGAGRSIAFNGGMSIGSSGLLHVDGEAVNGATVNGVLSLGSGGLLRGDGRAIVNGALTLHAGGVIETEDADVELRLNGFTDLSGGQILGSGTVLQTGNADVTADTTITVDTYDMDGLFGTSTIDVMSGQTLRVQSPSIESTPGDGYDGTLNIHNGTVDMAHPWALEGTVNFHDTGTGQPQLDGSGSVTVQSGGTMNFNGGTAVVNSPVTVNNGTIFVDADTTWNGLTTLGANAMVDINDANDSLRLANDVVMIAPTIVGNGRLVLDGSVNIAFANTTIGVAETDLDGTGITTDNVVTINNGLTLSISSTTIEPTANDGFDGTIHNGGTFSVLAGWRLDGTLHMDRPAGASTLNGGPFEIFGSGRVEARNDVVINPNTTVRGTIDVIGGNTHVNGSATFLPTANISVTTNGELELNGPTEFNGGTYAGQGTMQWDGPVTVLADTEMNLGAVDLDGTSGTTVTTLTGSRLALYVDRVDTVNNVNRFDGTLNMASGATLAVNLNDPNESWQMHGTINMNGGTNRLTGSPFRLTNTLNVSGTGVISAPMDLSGTVTTALGTHTIRLEGGTHVIRGGASLTGPGELWIEPSGHMMAEDGTTIGVDFVNLGRFEPGLSIGRVSAGDEFVQTATATLAMEIAGAPGVAQDLFQVTNTADLAGELEVTVVDGTQPSIGPVYTLLTAASISGTFDAFTLISHPIFAYQASLSYGSTRVTLRFTDVSMFGDFNDDLTLDCTDIDALVAEIAGGGMGQPFDLNGDSTVNIQDLNLWLDMAGTFNVGGPYLGGDANLDGSVDGTDFNTWNSHKFTFDNGWCGGDFNADGATDGADFNIWNANNFQSSASAAAVPEPAIAWMLGMACAWHMARRETSPQPAPLHPTGKRLT